MFDSNRGALGSLYQETSYLTFEGTKLQGVAAIVQKLTSLPFQARAFAVEADVRNISPRGKLVAQ